MNSRNQVLTFRHALLACLAFLAVATITPKDAAAESPSWPCINNVPTLNWTVPDDATIADQQTFNCFAWQEFIALNWPAAAGQRGVPDTKALPADYGNPGAARQTVWETYMDPREIFLPGGKKPNPWNNVPTPTHKCASVTAGAQAMLAKPGTRALPALSAFGDFVLDSTQEASGQWLADQNGNLIYYEVKVNQVEFESIVKNGFYNADVQNATAKTGVNPTKGGDNQVKLPTGAIEMKAAWRILPDPSQTSRYLTTSAVLIHPDGSCTSETVGLVGLHIIHKTPSQPQFVWATFEHRDNLSPTAPGAKGATFNNPDCKCEVAILPACGGSNTPFQNCTSNQKKGDACSSNVLPANYPPTANCPAYPVQVTRNRSISDNKSDPIVGTNKAAWNLLTQANPKTVFQYYQLVDVLWSTSPQDDYANGGSPMPPLSMSGATPDPDALPVANTTMETYIQGRTCLSCHVNATVPAGTYASDFSFIMGHAKSSSDSAAEVSGGRRRLPEGLVKFHY